MSGQPKYYLTERIAQGGMAEIHLGKSVGLDGFSRACAFKRILPHFASDKEFIDMFRNEAMVAKQLQNKNIVQVIDFVSDGQSYMLVMEFVDGQDLRALLAGSEAQKKKIPIDICCYIIMEALSGLAYAHSAVDVTGKNMGIIHRDVSPQNILLSYEGDIKITDFGIAKATNQSSNTRAGVLKGKFRYMSPEQAMGENVDSRTDLFAIGIILYEMVTMSRLFKGDDMAVLELVRKCEIKKPSEVNNSKCPEELEKILLKLLCKDKQKRYQNARDAIKDLSKFLYSFRPDFFPGDVAEFMQLVFRDNLEKAKDRLRATLAIPTGAIGGDIPELGMGADAQHHPIGVIDLSSPRKTPPQGGPFFPGLGPVGGQTGNSLASGLSPLGSVITNYDSKKLSGLTGIDNNNQISPLKPLELNSAGNFSAGMGYKSTGNTNVGARVDINRYAPKPQIKISSASDTFRNIIVTLIIFIILVSGAVFVKARMKPPVHEIEYSTTPHSDMLILKVGGKFPLGSKPVPVPLKFEVSAEKDVEISLKRIGFKEKKIILKRSALGTKLKETLVLEKEDKRLGSIKITTNPSGAKIYFDKWFEVQSPYTFEYLPLGEYSVRIVHPRCSPLVFQQVLRAGDEKELSEKEFSLKDCKNLQK
jgi:serine/threonine protein kinase